MGLGLGFWGVGERGGGGIEGRGLWWWWWWWRRVEGERVRTRRSRRESDDIGGAMEVRGLVGFCLVYRVLKWGF